MFRVAQALIRSQQTPADHPRPRASSSSHQVNEFKLLPQDLKATHQSKYATTQPQAAGATNRASDHQQASQRSSMKRVKSKTFKKEREPLLMMSGQDEDDEDYDEIAQLFKQNISMKEIDAYLSSNKMMFNHNANLYDPTDQLLMGSDTDEEEEEQVVKDFASPSAIAPSEVIQEEDGN